MKKSLLFAALALGAMGLAFGGTITVTQPAGGDIPMGTTVQITWTAVDVGSHVRIRLVLADGSLVQLLEDDCPAGGSPYPWRVANPAEVGRTYKIQVRALDNSARGESAAFTVTEAGGPGPEPPAGAVRDVRLSGAPPYAAGGRVAITWSAAGVSQPLKLQLLQGGALVGVLVSGLPASTSFLDWPAGRHIGGQAPDGDNYSIRVGTVDNSQSADSAPFSLTGAAALDLPDCDLQLAGVGVEHYNGNIVAWVKNNGPDSLRDHDLKFRLNFPEGGRGEQIITRRITVAAGSEKSVELQALSRDDIPDAGLRTSVRIDPSASRIRDANRLNQHRDVRLCALDLHCWLPLSEFEVVKKYTLPSKYVVRAHVHVRHNLGREVRNVHVHCYVSRSRGGGPLLAGADGHALITEGESEFTIASLLPGQVANHFIEQEYYSERGFPPTLSDGTTYYVIAKIVDAENRFCDPIPANDEDTRSFTTPD